MIQLFTQVQLPTNDFVSGIVEAGNTVIAALQTISVPYTVIMTIGAALLFAYSDQKSQLAKSMWFRIALASIVIFGAASLVQYFNNIGQSQF